jgi:hypothetical protein
MPAPEQVAPEPASRSRLQQAAAWSVAALITLAAAISVLLSRTVAGATASATPARGTAKPLHHHPGPQPRRARAGAHAHRVMTAHAVKVAARARRTRVGGCQTGSSTYLGVQDLARGDDLAPLPGQVFGAGLQADHETVDGRRVQAVDLGRGGAVQD